MKTREEMVAPTATDLSFFAEPHAMPARVLVAALDRYKRDSHSSAAHKQYTIAKTVDAYLRPAASDKARLTRAKEIYNAMCGLRGKDDELSDAITRQVATTLCAHSVRYRAAASLVVPLSLVELAVGEVGQSYFFALMMGVERGVLPKHTEQEIDAAIEAVLVGACSTYLPGLVAIDLARRLGSADLIATSNYVVATQKVLGAIAYALDVLTHDERLLADMPPISEEKLFDEGRLVELLLNDKNLNHPTLRLLKAWIRNKGLYFGCGDAGAICLLTRGSASQKSGNAPHLQQLQRALHIGFTHLDTDAVAGGLNPLIQGLRDNIVSQVRQSARRSDISVIDDEFVCLFEIAAARLRAPADKGVTLSPSVSRATSWAR